MLDAVLNVDRNEKEQLRESNGLSCNTDVKDTYLTSKKLNVGTTDRIEVPVHNNEMNVINDVRTIRSNQTRHRIRSKRKHKSI